MSKRTPKEVWQRLLISNNQPADFYEIYSTEFFMDFARHFNRSPYPFELIQGVHKTAQAYLKGKQEKIAEHSKMQKHTGRHLFNAGLSAKSLSYALRQISKSEIAASMVDDNLPEHLHEIAGKGALVHQSTKSRFGPSHPLKYIEELSEALSRAIGDIVELSGPKDDEGEFRYRAMAYPETFNEAQEAKSNPLAKYHALEAAAIAFRPTWEACSSLEYIRGGFRHELGRYDSKPAYALFQIVSKLDTQIPASRTGTAIENIRTQS